MSLVESARECDLNKYYQPWQATSLQTIPPNAEDRSHIPVRSSHDTTLTALAQLAALRLNVKRCLISLIDSSTQTILAEATQTLSLVSHGRHAPGDHLWLGNVSLPRRDCMDEHVFGSNCTGTDSDGSMHTIPALVVSDTTQDDRFRMRPYVTSHPAVRFYAGVPIVTKEGYSIGVYSVSDVAPRPEGLTVDELRFMQDVSSIVTEHLERVKSSIDRDRGERVVRSLASFVEGLSYFKHKLDHENKLQRTESSSTTKLKRPSGPQAVDSQSNTHQSGHDETFAPTNQSVESGSMVEEHNEKNINDTLPRYSRETSLTSNTDGKDESATNIQQIFNRAARKLQKGLSAEGCIFYDASPGLPSSISVNYRDRSGSDLTLDNASRESLQGKDNHLDPDTYPLSPGKVSSPKSHRSFDNLCQVLGSSASLYNGERTRGVSLSRKKLKRYLHSYPYGKVFYHNRGSVVTSNQSSSDNVVTGGGNDTLTDAHDPTPSDSSVTVAESLPKEFLDQVPNAKWLIFLPLFNYAVGQWFAGGFIWFTDKGPSDPQNEMPYLKAFGSCIMSEVASMEAVNTNIAKTRFIASISHDLRSPLHGMLGSLEFLEDTLTSAYQLSLLGSIETCGKTLLDTIDHLLDYAKINNLTLARTASTRSLDKLADTGNTGGNSRMPLRMSTFDISVLMEEVIEAVFAGQTFRKKRIRGRDSIDEAVDGISAMTTDDSLDTEEQIHAGSAKFSGKVFVVCDIHKAGSWKVKSQPGAVRRVIMNIFGNAVKYCRKGAIEASLSIQPRTASEADVLIEVKDSGIGMSQAFLERHLFRAFTQEDSFTSGAGLGMSIVHQIVQSLEGTIRVESEKGVGTNVCVRLPMQLAPEAADEEEDMLAAALRVTKGKRLSLLVPDVDDENAPSMEEPEGHLSKLTASIARMCEEWFDLEFVETKTIDIETDFLMYSEPPPIEVLTTYHSRRQAAGLGSKEIALLIICTNAFEAAALRAAGISNLLSLGRIIEVINQPVGVRKMAKVLLQSFQRVQQSRQSTGDSATSDTSSQTLGISEAAHRASEVEWNTSSLVYDEHIKKHRPSIEAFKWKSEQPQIASQLNSKAHDQREIEFGQIKSGFLPAVTPFESRSERANSSDQARVPTVLLVDDNAINLKLLVTFMKKIQLPYAQAENGLEALQKFKEAEQPFDFVLMDLQMPVMDGLQSTRKIREYEREKKTKTAATIIAITGVGDAKVKAECMDMGFDQFLTKPVKFKVLQQLLERQRITSTNT